MTDNYLQEYSSDLENWTSTKLNSFSSNDVQYGLNIESESHTNYGIKFIRITDINTIGSIKEKWKVYLDKSKVNSEYILKKGDIHLARSGAL